MHLTDAPEPGGEATGAQPTRRPPPAKAGLDLSRLERLLESLAEAPFKWPSTVSWSAMASQLIAALARAQAPPSSCRVLLSPPDFDGASRAGPAAMEALRRLLVEAAAREEIPIRRPLRLRFERAPALAGGQVRVVIDPGQEMPSETLPFAPQPGAPGLALLLDGRVIVLHRPQVRLGRARDNDLVLDDPSVSRHHARIERVGSGHELSDLGSQNGTYVNGRRVESAPLAEGDRVRLGSREIEVHRLASP